MHKWFSAVGLCAGFLWVIAIAAPSDVLRYRLAGVVITGDTQLAIIETSDGTQTLGRSGDRLEAYTIESIEAGGVRLRHGHDEIYLPLRGVPATLEEIAANDRVRELEVMDGHATQSVDYARARLAIARLNALPAATQNVEEAAREKRRLNERLNEALGLPKNTVIRAVDRSDVGSPREAILHLTGRLQSGQSMRLEVDGIPGVDVMYTRPVEGSATDAEDSS